LEIRSWLRFDGHALDDGQCGAHECIEVGGVANEHADDDHAAVRQVEENDAQPLAWLGDPRGLRVPASAIDRERRRFIAMHEIRTPNLNQLAAQATTHCLTGCAAGEIVGLVIASWLAFAVLPSIALAIALAYVFGFGLTMRPLLAGGMAFAPAARLALAADTVTITIMEAVDNAFILAMPGAMDAGLFDPLFWFSIVVGFAIAWVVTFPVSRWLIARGQGHALTHAAHGSADGAHGGPDGAHGHHDGMRHE
jgi:hypothetical protein